MQRQTMYKAITSNEFCRRGPNLIFPFTREQEKCANGRPVDLCWQGTAQPCSDMVALIARTVHLPPFP